MSDRVGNPEDRFSRITARMIESFEHCLCLVSFKHLGLVA